MLLKPDVNVAAINELADFLESTALGFSMKEACTTGVAGACGSACCIGGHAAAMWPEVRESYHASNYFKYFTWDDEKLALKLGVSEEAIGELCFINSRCAEDGFFEYDTITIDKAVRVLRNLAVTGEVDWSAVL